MTGEDENALPRALTAIGVAPDGWAVRSVWAWESISVVIRPLDIAAIWCRLMFLKKLYIGCARSPGKSLSRTAQPSAVSAICAMGSSSFDWLGAAAVWGATPSRARGSVEAAATGGCGTELSDWAWTETGIEEDD